MAVIFKGFSTVQDNKRKTLTDQELVKQDLLNHFNTRKGERPMNADFGTIIWDLLFDPLDQRIRDAITDDVTQIIAADPRVQLLGVFMEEYEHGILLQVELFYRRLDSKDKLFLRFERNRSVL